MLRAVRAAFRAIAFSVVTGFLFVLHVATVPVMRLVRLPGERWSGRIFRAWARSAVRIIGGTVSVEGSPPDAPFLLVSNHLSYVDVAVLASRLDCVFVAKNEVENWPVFGTLCRAVGTIFVDRASKRDIPRVGSLITRKMKSGKGVVIFPEGTSTEGETVLRFKPALLEPAAAGEIPVRFATLTYRTPPSVETARDAVCWWGGTPFLGHLSRLLRLARFEAHVIFGDRAISHRDRKVLAAELWSAVNDRFSPVTGSEGRASTQKDPMS